MHPLMCGVAGLVVSASLTTAIGQQSQQQARAAKPAATVKKTTSAWEARHEAPIAGISTAGRGGMFSLGSSLDDHMVQLLNGPRLSIAGEVEHEVAVTTPGELRLMDPRVGLMTWVVLPEIRAPLELTLSPASAAEKDEHPWFSAPSFLAAVVAPEH